MNYLETKDLTSNTLKIIAIVAMFFDHLFVIFVPQDTVGGMSLRITGRIVAPIMCYMVAEGYYYTSNIKRYSTRLLIFALLSHIPYVLCFGYGFFQATSVIWGLALGLIALAIAKNENLPTLIKIISVVGLCILSRTANWNYVSVLWILAFGIYRGDFKKQMICFSIISVVFHIIPEFIYSGIINKRLVHWYQVGVFLAIPILALYKGRRGKKNCLLKWGFYIFYPVHLLFIYFLRIAL